MSEHDTLPAGEADIFVSVQRVLERAHGRAEYRDRPFITVTYAQSLDGCIAGADGETLPLSNAASLKLTHQMRVIHDAILVGINTVLRDDPRLNVRLVEGDDPQPFVVDSRLRFPLDAKLLRDPCVRPIVLTSERADEAAERRLIERGARIVRVSESPGEGLDLHQIFACVRHHGCRSVMVEGGASIITSLLMSRLADQYLLTVSPRIVAGLRAVKCQPGVDYRRMPHLLNLQYQWLDGDLILRGDLARSNGHGSEDSAIASVGSDPPHRNGQKETR